MVMKTRNIGIIVILFLLAVFSVVMLLALSREGDTRIEPAPAGRIAPASTDQFLPSGDSDSTVSKPKKPGQIPDFSRTNIVIDPGKKSDIPKTIMIDGKKFELVGSQEIDPKDLKVNKTDKGMSVKLKMPEELLKKEKELRKEQEGNKKKGKR